MNKPVLASAAILLAAAASFAAVELVPFRLEENRVAQLVKDDIGRSPESLKLTFTLKGSEAEAAAKYGELKLEEAVDDKGTKLLPDKDPFNEAEKFKEFSNAFFRKMEAERKHKLPAPQIDINLKVPPRAATKIARLKGSVTIMSQGTIRNVEASGFKPGDKKKLNIPANAGLTITLNIKEGNDITDIGYDLVGNESALESIDVVDAKGESVSAGTSSWTLNDKVQRSISLQQPLDAKMKVVAKIATDRKVTKVPFDLKDIALP